MKLNSYNKIFLFFVMFLLITACGSSKRFTSDEKSDNYRENKNSTNGYLLTETGEASYYADKFNGKKTANGETYNMFDLTAAHPNLPFDTEVRILNLKNNKEVIVRINDRMPNFKSRIIDLSYAAAKKIDMISDGITEIKLEVISLGK